MMSKYTWNQIHIFHNCRSIKCLSTVAWNKKHHNAVLFESFEIKYEVEKENV
jgi:hypothetical protein